MQTSIDFTATADRPHAWRVTVRGDLDIHSATSFDDIVDVVVDSGGRFLLVDMADVEFVDSSGLRSIVRASQRLAGMDGRLTVTGLSGAAARVLEITGLLEQLREPGDSSLTATS
jgi:anti-sigma B factor antagonist